MNKVANEQSKIVNSSPAKKKKKNVSLNKKKEKVGWLFVMPFLVGFIAIYIPVIFESLYFSFMQSQSTAAGNIYIPVGFANYKYALFSDPKYLQLMVDNVLALLLDVPAIVIFSLFLAILLNQKMLGRAAFRAIFFIPVITSTGIIQVIDMTASFVDTMQNIGNIDSGAAGVTTNNAADLLQVTDFSRLFDSVFIGQQYLTPILGLANSVYRLVDRTGVQMLIFLAGLQSISPSIYESCYMEGASEWETFWKITIPMISPMILVNLVFTIIDSFTRQENTVMKFIADTIKGLNGPDGYTHGTAMAWLYFLFIILIVALLGTIFSSAYVFYQRRDNK